jgi:hypothetical protein
VPPSFTIYVSAIGALVLAAGWYEVRFADRIVETLRTGNPWWVSFLLARLWYRPFSIVPFSDNDPGHAAYIRFSGRCNIVLGGAFLTVTTSALAYVLLQRA